MPFFLPCKHGYIRYRGLFIEHAVTVQCFGEVSHKAPSRACYNKFGNEQSAAAPCRIDVRNRFVGRSSLAVYYIASLSIATPITRAMPKVERDGRCPLTHRRARVGESTIKQVFRTSAGSTEETFALITVRLSGPRSAKFNSANLHRDFEREG
jgi:hypothetical protein